MSTDISTTGDQVVPVVEADLLADTTTATGPDTTLARRSQRGMVSAEWTVGIIAAIAMAGVLLAVVTSGPVEKLLLQVIMQIIRAFTAGL